MSIEDDTSEESEENLEGQNEESIKAEKFLKFLKEKWPEINFVDQHHGRRKNPMLHRGLGIGAATSTKAAPAPKDKLHFLMDSWPELKFNAKQ